MFPRSLRVARIGGVDVHITPSWVLLAALVTGSFHLRYAVPDRDGTATLLMALAAAALFFLSLLGHELAHAWEGRHREVPVHGITLMLYGGVTEMGAAPRRPRDEFAISAVGPYVSLVAAALLGLVATFTRAFGGPAEVAEVAGTVGWLNVVLAVFNLLPGAPLDGGRVLRAAIWAVTKDRYRAVRWASYAGQALAGVLLLWALWLFVYRPETYVSALWSAVIGWFMWQAARAERQQAELEQLLEGRTVASLTVAAPPRLPAERTLEAAAHLMAAAAGTEVFPVVAERDGDDRGRLVGALRLADVMGVDPHDRPFRTVAEMMRPIGALREVREDDDLLAVASSLAEGETVVVVDADGEPRALLAPGQVRAALDRWHALTRRREHHLAGSHHEDAGR